MDRKDEGKKEGRMHGKEAAARREVHGYRRKKGSRKGS